MPPERVELSHLAVLVPKTSVSANSTKEAYTGWDSNPH